MSGTCAKTLFPKRRFAFIPSATSFLAVSTPKNATVDGIPFSISTAATLPAGLSRTGIPLVESTAEDIRHYWQSH